MFPNSGLYDDNWTRWIDDQFIAILYWFATIKNKRLMLDDEITLQEVQQKLAQEEKAVFSMAEIRARFQLAEERYKTWDAIINRDDVQYDIVKNMVVASDDTWEEIFSEHKLAEFYWHSNEHMWNNLLEIFGPDSARLFGQTERTPRRISSRLYSAEELLEESVIMQSKVDDVKHLRKLLNDPQNKKFVGQNSSMNLNDVLPMPTNPALGIEDFFNGTPEERFDREKDSKAKRCLDF